MTQTIPLTVQLGSGNTGLTIGYTVLELDRTEYSAFTTTGVSESVIPGTYYVSGGVIVPDEGGYIVAGESGSDLVEVAVEPAPATILTTAVAGYADTPGTFGYLLSLLAGLDFTAVNLVAASNAGGITIKRGVNLLAVVSGLTIPADWTAAYWTVKRSTDDADADALAQILVSNPPDAEDDGLLVLAGAAVLDPDVGSMAINQALGTATIALDYDSTAELEDAVELVWDVKVHAPAGKTQPGAGTATITTAVTRA